MKFFFAIRWNCLRVDVFSFIVRTIRLLNFLETQDRWWSSYCCYLLTLLLHSTASCRWNSSAFLIFWALVNLPLGLLSAKCLIGWLIRPGDIGGPKTHVFLHSLDSNVAQRSVRMIETYLCWFFSHDYGIRTHYNQGWARLLYIFRTTFYHTD